MNIVHQISFNQAKFPQHHLQLLGGDVTVAVLVENLKRLPQIRILLLLLLVLDQPEVGLTQRLVQRHEILVRESLVAGSYVEFRHGLQLRHVGVQAEEAQRLADLRDGDGAVAVLVEHVEDAAEAEGVEAAAAEAEGRRGRGEGDFLLSHYHPQMQLAMAGNNVIGIVCFFIYRMCCFCSNVP